MIYKTEFREYKAMFTCGNCKKPVYTFVSIGSRSGEGDWTEVVTEAVCPLCKAVNLDYDL